MSRPEEEKATWDEFYDLALPIVKSTSYFVSRIAAKLSVSKRQVQRWRTDGFVPVRVMEELRDMMGRNATAGPWPRDEWILGDARGGDGCRRDYLIHAYDPRFICRVVYLEEDGEPAAGTPPFDMLSGVSYGDINMTLCEFEWIDPPDQLTDKALTSLMDGACDAVERIATYESSHGEDGY